METANGKPAPTFDYPTIRRRLGRQTEKILLNGHAKAHAETPPPNLIPDRYRERIEAALGDCKGKPVRYDRRPKVPDQPPGPDFKTDWRAAGVVMSFLQHDTPERAAVLKAVGLEPGSLSPRIMRNIGESMLRVNDKELAKEEFTSWLKYHNPPDRDGTKPRMGLNVRRLSEVMEKDVDWLWPQRVPLGNLTLISGDPGLGKTWAILDIMARVTTGRDFPDGSANPFKDRSSFSTRRDVLWVSAEDADEDTVKPRFLRLGGDPSRFHSLAFVLERVEVKRKEYEDRQQSLDLSRHLTLLDDWLFDHPRVAVVALDPLSAFLGKTDTHRNSDVRGLLTPLMKLADRHRVAVVGNNHLHKGESDNALYRSMGSIAFVAAARSSWLVTKDPKEPKDRRLFTAAKNNYQSEEVGGLSFRVGPEVPGAFFWEEGRVETTADEALRVPERETSAPARSDAKEMLRDLLKDGPVVADEVWKRVDADRMCKATVNAAAKELGVRRVKTGGRGSPWAWSLPKAEDPR